MVEGWRVSADRQQAFDAASNLRLKCWSVSFYTIVAFLFTFLCGVVVVVIVFLYYSPLVPFQLPLQNATL